MPEPTTAVKLVPITRANWERALELRVAEDQRDFIPENLHSIAQSRFEQSELYGIYQDKTMVGFVMVCFFSHVPWVTRLMVDAAHQGRRIGREALAALLQKLLSRPNVHEVRTTVHMRNAAGEYLFHSLGFERTGEIEGREIVMRLAM